MVAAFRGGWGSMSATAILTPYAFANDTVLDCVLALLGCLVALRVAVLVALQFSTKLNVVWLEPKDDPSRTADRLLKPNCTDSAKVTQRDAVSPLCASPISATASATASTQRLKALTISDAVEQEQQIGYDVVAHQLVASSASGAPLLDAACCTFAFRRPNDTVCGHFPLVFLSFDQWLRQCRALGRYIIESGSL